MPESREQRETNELEPLVPKGISVNDALDNADTKLEGDDYDKLLKALSEGKRASVWRTIQGQPRKIYIALGENGQFVVSDDKRNAGLKKGAPIPHLTKDSAKYRRSEKTERPDEYRSGQQIALIIQGRTVLGRAQHTETGSTDWLFEANDGRKFRIPQTKLRLARHRKLENNQEVVESGKVPAVIIDTPDRFLVSESPSVSSRVAGKRDETRRRMAQHLPAEEDPRDTSPVRPKKKKGTPVIKDDERDEDRDEEGAPAPAVTAQPEEEISESEEKGERAPAKKKRGWKLGWPSWLKFGRKKKPAAEGGKQVEEEVREETGGEGAPEGTRDLEIEQIFESIERKFLNGDIVYLGEVGKVVCNRERNKVALTFGNDVQTFTPQEFRQELKRSQQEIFYPDPELSKFEVEATADRSVIDKESMVGKRVKITVAADESTPENPENITIIGYCTKIPGRTMHLTQCIEVRSDGTPQKYFGTFQIQWPKKKNQPSNKKLRQRETARKQTQVPDQQALSVEAMQAEIEKKFPNGSEVFYYGKKYTITNQSEGKPVILKSGSEKMQISIEEFHGRMNGAKSRQLVFAARPEWENPALILPQENSSSERVTLAGKCIEFTDDNGKVVTGTCVNRKGKQLIFENCLVKNDGEAKYLQEYTSEKKILDPENPINRQDPISSSEKQVVFTEGEQHLAGICKNIVDIGEEWKVTLVNCSVLSATDPYLKMNAAGEKTIFIRKPAELRESREKVDLKKYTNIQKAKELLTEDEIPTSGTKVTFGKDEDGNLLCGTASYSGNIKDVISREGIRQFPVFQVHRVDPTGKVLETGLPNTIIPIAHSATSIQEKEVTENALDINTIQSHKLADIQPGTPIMRKDDSIVTFVYYEEPEGEKEAQVTVQFPDGNTTTKSARKFLS